MRTVDRRVDRHIPDDIASRLGLGHQTGMDPIPRPIDAEPVMTLPDRLPRAEIRRKITPGNAGAEPVDDPLDHCSVLTERSTSLAARGRHQRLNSSPLRIGHKNKT